MARLPEHRLADSADLDHLLRDIREPIVIRGLVEDWPLVAAGRVSGEAARDYLLERHQDRLFVVSVGPAGEKGYQHYRDDMALNVTTERRKLPDIFCQIAASEEQPEQPILYCSSIDVHGYFPGLHEANQVDLGDRSCLASIWMGTRSRIAAHNDVPHNLACVAVGRRRFTLFPPAQFRNLYLGPVDNTPAGRAVSMVDFHAPDFQRFPKFRSALDVAQVAELAAGDAIVIPSLWWHHIEGLDPFNVLINYWWRDTPRYLGQPQDALHHAMLAIRDLPPAEKQHWRDMFAHYVFDNGDDATAHIPPAARGVLGPMTAENAGKMRNFLLRALSQ